MDDIAKSKSSNGAVTTKSDRLESHKKTRSTAGFGSTVSRAQQSSPKQQRRPPPRPRPGQKKFIASVFTLLSKSTTGTQFPSRSTEKLNKTFKHKTKELKNNDLDFERTPANFDENLNQGQKTKKKKYTSKSLNKKVNEDEEKIVVLQPKKEITQTPSMFSENYETKSTDTCKENPEISSIKDYLDSVHTEVERIKNKELQRRIETKEMNTTNNSKQEQQNDNKDDKRLYDFFVDLLETTYNAYSKEKVLSNEPSPTKLVIEENVLDKLNVTQPIRQKSPVRKLSISKTDDPETWNDIKLLENFHYQNFSTDLVRTIQPKAKLKSKPKLKSKSVIEPSSKSPKTVKTKKKSKGKENLLNILKEELLHYDDLNLEEPQNFYDALKQIAKTKRKSIQFQEPKKLRNKDDCMRNPRVISSVNNNYTAKSRDLSPRRNSNKFYKRKDYDDKITKSLYRVIPERYRDLKNQYLRKMDNIKSDSEVESTYHSLDSIEIYDFDDDKVAVHNVDIPKKEPMLMEQHYTAARLSSHSSIVEKESSYSFSEYQSAINYGQ